MRSRCRVPCPTRRGRRKSSAIRVRWFGRASASIDRHHAASDGHAPGPADMSASCRRVGVVVRHREPDRDTSPDVTRPSAVPPPLGRMARQLPILWLCLPHGIETVACRSSCSLGSSRSRWEAMRHGLPWREVMRAVTSVNSAAVAASVRAFREGESSGAAASLAAASVTIVSLTGSTADEASSRTWALIPTATSTTWITGTIRTTRTTRTPAATRTPATATCLHTPTLNTASGRTVRRTRSTSARATSFAPGNGRERGVEHVLPSAR